MSKKEVYEQKAEALLLPIIEANNFELVDVEYVKEGSNWYLRAYIDKEGGISVDDCEVVSRAFSDKLDEEDFIDDAYGAWEKNWKSELTVRLTGKKNFMVY